MSGPRLGILNVLAISVALGAGALATPLAAEEVSVPSPASPKSDDRPRFFLLTIGVGAYQDPFWPELKWPADDARAVFTALGRGTGMERVTRALTDQAATRSGVSAALKAMAKDVRSRDVVVVYVSGHGTLSLDAHGNLEKLAVLYDTPASNDAAFDEKALPQREVALWLEQLPARRKLVIYATCHGGVGKSKLSPKLERFVRSTKGEAEFAALEDVSEGTLVLAAAAGGEAAREDDRLKGDVYTHFLLEGADAFDRNRDGVITALEAHDYAKERTYAWSRGRQRPTAEAAMIGDADVPLTGTRQRTGLPVLEAYDQGLSGYAIAVDGGVKGKLPLAFPLKATGSRVSLYGPGEDSEAGGKGKRRQLLAEYEVQAERGERIDLAAVMAPPPWSIGVAVAKETWGDSAFRDLTGESNWTVLTAEVEYRQEVFSEMWTVGVAYSPERTTGGDLRPELAAELSVSGWQGILGWEKSLAGAPNWMGTLSLGVGREHVKLTFTDGVDGETLVYEDRPLTVRLGGSIERSLQSDVGVALRADRTWATYAFGLPGDLGATRTAFGLALLWRFGGVARRL